MKAEFIKDIMDVNNMNHDQNQLNHLDNPPLHIMEEMESSLSIHSENDEIQQNEHFEEINELEVEHNEDIANSTLDLEIRHQQELSDQKQKLEKKHYQEMSDLRKYFEHIFKKQYTEEIPTHPSRSMYISSSSDDEFCDTETRRVRPRSADAKFASCNSSNKRSRSDKYYINEPVSKENFERDLHNITKAYEAKIGELKKDLQSKKDEEIEAIKNQLEQNYISRIEMQQKEICELTAEKELNLATKKVYNEVRQDYEKELRIAKNKLLSEFCTQIEEKVVNSDYLTSNSENILQLNSNNETELSDDQFKQSSQSECARMKLEYEHNLKVLNDRWKCRIEDLLNSLVTESALKKVLSQTKVQSEFDNHDEIVLKALLSSPKQNTAIYEELKHNNKKEMDALRDHYECRIAQIIEDHKNEVSEINRAQNTLQFNENNTNLQHAREINNLKKQHKMELLKLQPDQEIKIAEKIEAEIHRMKLLHDNEVSNLNREIASLNTVICELQNVDHRSTESAHVCSLIFEIQELLQKEENGEQPTWPAELVALQQLFYSKYCHQKSEQKENKIENYNGVVHFRENCSQLLQADIKQNKNLDHKLVQTELSDLEKILVERDGLRQLNITLQCAVRQFSKYLLNCEEELNNTLVGELLKLEDISLKESETSDLDYSLNETSLVRKVHFAPNMAEIMRLINKEQELFENINIAEEEQNLSILQPELNACLERLKNEAASLLLLTSGAKQQKVGTKNSSDGPFTHDIQTQVNFTEDIQNDLCIANNYISTLHQEVLNWRSAYDEAIKEIIRLGDETTELKEKIISLESVEGYGESLNSNSFIDNKIQVLSSAQKKEALSLMSDNEDLCHKCDKVKELAKREMDDLQYQLEAADKQLRGTKQFMESQAAERELERDEWEMEKVGLKQKIKTLEEQIKELERDLYAKNNFEFNICNLEIQIKELSEGFEESEQRKQLLESELNTAINKVGSLREVIQDLENKLADKSETAEYFQKQLKEKEAEFVQQCHEFQNMQHELESLKDGDAEQLQSLQEQYQASCYLLRRIKKQLLEIEDTITKRTKELESHFVTIITKKVTELSYEDVSVSEPIDDYGVTSPSGSETLSSPINMPNDSLSCLKGKMQKLYVAEEALLKHVRDQELDIEKLANQLEEAQIDKEVLEENLKDITSRYTYAKVKLDDFRHRDQVNSDDQVSKLLSRIKELELDIEKKSTALILKENKLSDCQKTVSKLEQYIEESELDPNKADKYEQTINNMRIQIDQFSKEKQNLMLLVSKYRNEANDIDFPEIFSLLLDEKNSEIQQLELKILSLQSNENQLHTQREENVKEIESKLHVMEKTLEDYQKQDCNNKKEILEYSVTINDLNRRLEEKSLVVSSTERKLSEYQKTINDLTGDLEKCKSELTTNTRNYKQALADVETKLDDLVKERQNLMRLTSKYRDEITDNDSNADIHLLFTILLDKKEKEIETLVQKMRVLQSQHSNCEEKISDLEECIHKCELEFQKQANKTDEDLSFLRKTLEQFKEEKSNLMTLVSQYSDNVDENIVELVTKLFHEKNSKIDQLEQEILSLRIQIENMKKYQSEYSSSGIISKRNHISISDEVYSSENSEILRCAVNTNSSTEPVYIYSNSYPDKLLIANDVNDLTVQIDIVPKIIHSTRVYADKNEEAPISNGDNTDIFNFKMVHLSRVPHLTEIIENEEGSNDHELHPSKESLQDLTEKVQKEVDLAVELQENILNNLDLDENFTNITIQSNGPPFSEDLKKMFIKILHFGVEELLECERRMFHDIVCNKDTKNQKNMAENTRMKELEEKLKSEEELNQDIASQLSERIGEIERLQMVLNHFEDRNSYFISKIEEWQHKATQSEIKYTKENARFMQLDILYTAEKKRMSDKQLENSRQIEMQLKRLSSLTNQNVGLKRELQDMRYKLENLTAELNSMRAIGQYNSESETEISRSINPLKLQLEEIQKRYNNAIIELEKVTGCSNELQVQLNKEIENGKELKATLETVNFEKHNLECKVNDLNLDLCKEKEVKRKMEEKLSVMEYNEKRKRNMNKADITKREHELNKLKNECLDMQKKLLQAETELNSYRSRCFCSMYESQVKNIICRMIRAESSRRSLTWQKQFLKRNCNFKGIKTDLKSRQRFRAVSICIIMIHRIKRVIEHRRIQCNKVMASHQSYNLLLQKSDSLPGNITVGKQVTNSIENTNCIHGYSNEQHCTSSLKHNTAVSDSYACSPITTSLVDLHAHFLQLQQKYNQEFESSTLE